MGTHPGPRRSAAEKQLWLVHLHLGPKRPPQQARVSLCASIHRRIRPGLWLPVQPHSPVAGQVNRQRKELEYTQKQSSATTKPLLGFWHLTISKIHQEESLHTLVFAEYLHRDCCFIAHICTYVLTQATPLVLQEAKGSAPCRQSPPDPPATGARTARGRITVFQALQRGSGMGAKPNISSTNKNPVSSHTFAIFFWHNLVCAAQAQPSRMKLQNCAWPAVFYISPLRCCSVPFAHINSPCLEFRSC